MAQYWDNKGRLHIEGEKPIPLAEQLARKAQAAITNIGNWINESNPNSEAYKQKANTALALLTLPIGAGAKVTQTIAQPLKASVGRQIAKTTAEGIGAGATGGAVEGFGNGLIEGENPLLSGAKGLLYGGIGGGLFGLGAGKIGQHIDFKNLYKNGTPEAFNKYFDDYIEGLNNYTKPMADYRAAQRGVRPQKARIENNFIGENAFIAPKGKLMEAKQMAMYGDSNADIRNATGWFKGVDGKWRYEIPDGRLIENPNVWETKNTGFDEYQISKLGDIYDNPELYQAYPKLKDLSILKSDLPDGVGGISTPNSIHIDNSLYSKHNPEYYEQLNKLKQTPEVKRMDEIVNEAVKNGYSEKLDNEYNNILSNTENGKLYNSLVFKHNIPQRVEGWNDDALDTFVHEIQHQIQGIEDFARGGNSSLNPNYKNLAGEVEARLAGARAKLTPEQRQIYNPANESTYLTNYGYDVIPEKQIVEFRDNNLANSLKYRDEWVKIGDKDYRILNLPKKDYGKILHTIDTYLKPEDLIGETVDWSDDMYKYTFQKVSPTDYKFIKRRKLK